MADDPQAVTPPQTTPPAPLPDYPPEEINRAMAIDASQPSATPLNMLTPASAAEPVPQQPLTLPPAPVEHHLSLMGRILDTVGSILGGDTTYRLTKAADGSMSIAPEASTTGEKWGRVAAAALGGLAAGLPQSFGPAGVAGGASAGFQAGMQQPVQQRQQQEQAIDFQNRQLLAKANRIHLTQQNYLLAQEARFNDLQINEKSAESLGKYLNLLRSSPNAQDLGPIDPSDPNAAMNAAKRNPQAMDGLLGRNNKVLQPVIAPDHKLHLIVTDAGWEDQRSTEPMPIFDIGKDDKGQPTLTSTRVAPAGTKVSDVTAYNLGQMTKYYGFLKNYAEAQKAMAPSPMTGHLTGTPGATAALIAQRQRELQAETDPTRRQQIQSEIDNLQNLHAQQLRDVQAGRPVSFQPMETPSGQVGYINPRNPAAPPVINPQVAGRVGQAQAPWPTTGPAAAYPPGTPGITPKQIGKIPADTAKAARLARSAIQNSQEVINILRQHPDLTGRLNSLGSRWQQAVGVSGDDPLTQLQAAVEQSTQASLGAHSYRGTQYAREKEHEATNGLKNDPSSIIAYMQERIRSNQQFVDEENNYLRFGTPEGPEGPPPNQQQQQQQQQQQPATRGTRSIADVRRLVPRYQNATDDEIRRALTEQHYNVVP